MRPWVQTISGEKIDLLQPQPETIHLTDIAYSLSRLPRYTSHSRFMLPVAQHSVLCAAVAPPELAYEALLHDAHEAYLGDINGQVYIAVRELCRAMGFADADPLKELVRRLRHAVARKFNLQLEIPDEVKLIDARMLQTERLAVMKRSYEWNQLDGIEPYDNLVIKELDAYTVEATFLDWFERCKSGLAHMRTDRGLVGGG